MGNRYLSDGILLNQQCKLSLTVLNGWTYGYKGRLDALSICDLYLFGVGYFTFIKEKVILKTDHSGKVHVLAHRRVKPNILLDHCSVLFAGI